MKETRRNIKEFFDETITLKLWKFVIIILLYSTVVYYLLDSHPILFIVASMFVGILLNFSKEE